jgi:two-component system KDP operon response regulator KdpE
MSVRVLLIHDDPAIARDLRSAFVPEGYYLDHALPGPQTFRKIILDEPDVVILGIKPDKVGWQGCCHLLTFLDQPLLLLLCSTDTEDRVKGLALGADDCMTEPILASEVVERVRALLRRAGPQTWRPVRSYFADGDLLVDLIHREVWLDGQQVALTPTEFRLLSCFTQHVGEVMSHERLKRQVWGSDCPGDRAAIKQYVYQLRQKLERAPSHPQRILSRRGQGYLFRSLADGRRDSQLSHFAR